MVVDVFMIGCRIQDSVIYPEFNELSPDMKKPLYNTELGIYCGLENIMCSWGHDKYLYQILKSEKKPNYLPEEALYIVIFHDKNI